MTVFNARRGSFVAVDLDTSSGQGIQVSIPGGDPVDSSSLVTSFSVMQAENYAISQCLNGGIFLYTYGHDPNRSQFTLGVTSFLNTCDGNVGESLANALASYRSGRVSESKALSTLTIGTGSMQGYLIGQGIDVVSPEIGIINTTYSFISLNAH